MMFFLNNSPCPPLKIRGEIKISYHFVINIMGCYEKIIREEVKAMRKIIFILIFIIAAFIILNLSYKIDESGEKTVVIAAGAVGSEFELTKRNCEEWTKTSGYKVRMFQSPNLTNDRLALFQQIFSAKSDEIDVVQIDVVWPMLLKKHFVDLRKFIPKKEVRKHFESIIRNASDGKGRLLAMPFYSDVGLIYYRKDLLEKHGVKPPSTWNEMKEAAIKVLEAEKREIHPLQDLFSREKLMKVLHVMLLNGYAVSAAERSLMKFLAE